MIYATKKSGESNERLLSRFKQVVQRSRVLLDAKKKRFHSGPRSERYIRASAIIRSKHRAEKAKQQFYS